MAHERSGWPKTLAEYVGYETLEAGEASRARMEIRPEHIAPNGFLQASVIIAMADMCCASGTFASVPEGASFTTIELKTNLISTARSGELICEAQRVHGGKTTQVWDASVTHTESGKRLALFRCTQLILYPK